MRVDEVRYDDGAEHRIDVVEHGPSFIAIVATPAPGEVGFGAPVPASGASRALGASGRTVEPGETPSDGARRELREETGYVAGRIRPVGRSGFDAGLLRRK